MSRPYFPSRREKEALLRLWHEVRDAAFTARGVPSQDTVIKDTTRHIEYTLILLENVLREQFGDLWKDVEDNHPPWRAP